MQQQDFKNHSRIAPAAYYSGILLGLIVFIVSLICFTCLSTNNSSMILPLLFSFTGISLIFTGYYARMFALKAQDRAIRAEENLRHFAMTGKLHDSRLSLSQIIALRFASDDEFLGLAKKAADENLSTKQIKAQIKNWRGDYWRV
jgi:hypothetical protein